MFLVLCTGLAVAGSGGDGPANPNYVPALSAPPEEQGVELPAKRTATSNTYRLPNGALQTRAYSSPINYRDGGGGWRPIVNRLERSPGEGITNTASAIELELPDRLGSGSTRVFIGGAWVSARLLDRETTPADLEGATATYEVVSSGTSFKLTSISNGVKEIIELADPTQPSKFRFELDASEGFEPSLQKDGSIAFRDRDDKLLALLPAPIISDSAPRSQPSNAVHYDLAPMGQDRWELTVEADADWLQAPNRVWPVRIDPTVVVVSPGLDCLFGGQVGKNGGGFCRPNNLEPHYIPGQSLETLRAALRFDLSAIPKDAYVADATIGLHANEPSFETTGVEVRLMRDTWTEQLTWQTRDRVVPWGPPGEGGGYFTSLGDEVRTASRGSQAGPWNFNDPSLTQGVQGWVKAGAAVNPGVVVKLIDDREPCVSPCLFRSVRFDSSVAADPSKRPFISATWYGQAPTGSKVTLPLEGTRSAKRFKLAAAWSHQGATGITFQYRGEGPWETIPNSQVATKDNQPVEWPLATEGARQSETVFWDASQLDQPESKHKLQVRAILDGAPGAEGYTQPVEVELNRATGGAKDAVAPIGPGAVNLLTGNFAFSRTDVKIPGFGSALEFSRTFNSRDPGDTGVLGQGWKPGVPVEEAGGASWRSIREIHLSEEGEEGETYSFDYAVLTDLDGGERAFQKVGSSYLTPPEMSGWSLSQAGANRIALADPAGNRTVFESSGPGSEYLPVAISQTGGPGNTTTMVYQLSGGNRRLSMAVAPAARGITCTEATATTQVGCRALTFTYKPATTWGAPAALGDRLASITYHAPGNGGPWEVASYAYDAGGRLTSAWDPRISPPLKETYGYASGGQIEAITPPGQSAWTLEYRKVGGEEGDGRLHKVKRTVFAVSPSSSLPTFQAATATIVYGVPISGAGAAYDMSGGAVSGWGQQDLPVDATAIFPPGANPADPPAGYEKATVHYMDAEGQLVNIATPSGAGTTAASITTTETDQFGNVVRELSAQNRLRALAAGSESVPRSHQLETKFLYSADGTELEEETGPLHQVRLESGSLAQARLHRVVQYDQGWPGTGLKPHLPTRETSGALVGGSFLEQRVTEYRHDWNLRKPTETIVDPSGLNIRSVTAYDEASGLPTETRQPSNPSGGGAGTTRIVYYSASTGSGDSACDNKPIFANLPCKILPAAQPGTSNQPPVLVRTFPSYSPLGQPTEIFEAPGGNVQLNRRTIMTYDEAGRPTSTRYLGGGVTVPKVEQIYDERKGLPTTRRFVCEASCEGFDTQATAIGYDLTGLPFEYVDADGNRSSTTYDRLGRPVKITDRKGTQEMVYDPTSGLLTELRDSGAGAFTAEYDADGNMVERRLPNGLTAETTYDETGEAVELTYTKASFCGASCTWLDFSSESSIHGQILAQTGTLSTESYAYDKAGRLIQAQQTPQGGGCTTRTYGYDQNSNRESMTTRQPGVGGICSTSGGATQNYSYDAADRLLGTGLVYDGFGRITALPAAYAGGKDLSTTYFSTDMVASQTQAGVSNTYQLDASLRQRQRIQAGGLEGSEVFHYADDSDSPAWTERGSTWTRNVVGIGGELAAIQESSGTTTFQLTNLHGDVVATVSANPEVTKLSGTFLFDEFGNPAQGTTPKYGWLGGKRRPAELSSGTIQMGARSYIPSIGRFLTPDPVEGGSANAYDYANQDPVNGLDLDGLRAKRRGLSGRMPARGGRARSAARSMPLISLIPPISIIPGPSLAEAVADLWNDVKDAVKDKAGEVAAALGAPAAASVFERAVRYAVNAAKGGARTAASVAGWVRREFGPYAPQLAACGRGAFAAFVAAKGPPAVLVSAAVGGCIAGWRHAGGPR